MKSVEGGRWKTREGRRAEEDARRTCRHATSSVVIRRRITFTCTPTQFPGAIRVNVQLLRRRLALPTFGGNARPFTPATSRFRMCRLGVLEDCLVSGKSLVDVKAECPLRGGSLRAPKYFPARLSRQFQPRRRPNRRALLINSHGNQCNLPPIFKAHLGLTSGSPSRDAHEGRPYIPLQLSSRLGLFLAVLNIP